MKNIKAQIKKESSTAAKLSKEALGAFAARDFATGKALMQQAVEAGRNCSELIEQYNLQSQSQS
jgi:NADPH-dependent glutamate synthase beta subunit-like oxidoreductase